ncbi:MAG: hypothetical protein ABH864_05960 [archaeon]
MASKIRARGYDEGPDRRDFVNSFAVHTGIWDDMSSGQIGLLYRPYRGDAVRAARDYSSARRTLGKASRTEVVGYMLFLAKGEI